MVWLILLFATLPYLNKAFHVDDVLYLRVADQILHTPLDPYHGLVLWDAPDGQPASLFQTDFNPPLWKYLLAGTIRLFGRSEWTLHLLESAFVWLAGLGVFRLSRRFSAFPVWCTAMIVLGPFFLPGQNIMLEGPLLCFSIWAIEWQCRAWQTGHSRWAWLAGVALALAVLTKYTAGLLFPLLALTSLWLRRPRALVVLVLPILALSLWLGQNVTFYGQPHLSAHGFTFDVGQWPARVLTVLRCIGAVTLFGPAIVLGLVRRRRGWAWLLLTLLIAGVMAWLDLTQARATAAMENWTPTALQAVHYILFTVHGTVILLGLLGLALLPLLQGGACSERCSARTPDISGSEGDHQLQKVGAPDRRESRWRHLPRFFLTGWLLLLLVFNVTSVPFNAIRHLLLGLVPLTWLVAEELAKWKSSCCRRNLLIASIGLGVILASADYELAGQYRKLARSVVAPRVAAGQHVWFTGNWGFVYYASQAGANPIVEAPARYGLPPVGAGDLIVNPILLTWKPFPPVGFPPVKATGHLQPSAWHPVRTLAPGVHFYYVAPHSLPWEVLVCSTAPDEKEAWFELPPVDDVVLYQVQPLLVVDASAGLGPSALALPVTAGRQ